MYFLQFYILNNMFVIKYLFKIEYINFSIKY